MVSCPVCSRPNGEDRHACIYCGAPLVDDAQVARETAAALLPPRPRGRPGNAVVILPGQASEASVGVLSDVLGCEAFQASQLLRRPDPLLVSCSHPTEVEAIEAQLRSGGVASVELEGSRLDAVPDAALIQQVDLGSAALQLTPVDGEPFSLGLDRLACVVVGRVEVNVTKEYLETRFFLDSDDTAHQVETVTESPSYDAFHVFDLYGSTLEPVRVRLLETVCTIQGRDYPPARRGAGFARFARWLTHRRPNVHVDERYLQLGQQHRTSSFSEGDRMLSYGSLRTKEFVGTEEEYSGQGFDAYSVITWAIWNLTRERSPRTTPSDG